MQKAGRIARPFSLHQKQTPPFFCGGVIVPHQVGRFIAKLTFRSHGLAPAQDSIPAAKGVSSPSWLRDQAKPENLSGGLSSMRSPPCVFGFNNRVGTTAKDRATDTSVLSVEVCAGLREARFSSRVGAQNGSVTAALVRRAFHGTKTACASAMAGSTRNRHRNFL